MSTTRELHLLCSVDEYVLRNATFSLSKVEIFEVVRGPIPVSKYGFWTPRGSLREMKLIPKKFLDQAESPEIGHESLALSGGFIENARRSRGLDQQPSGLELSGL